MLTKLNVNIDHVATIREARKATEPSIITAASICEQAGADGITVHLRGDRRHIQDKDIKLLRECVTTCLNVEMAATEEMVQIAIDIKPDLISLVPENPNEITTEGGLDIIENTSILRTAVKKLRDAGIFVSIFLDPDKKQIEAAQSVGAQQVELCTGEYAKLISGSRSFHGEEAMSAAREIRRIHDAAVHASGVGLKVAAGHGLNYRNVGALTVISEITELNIGHNIISRAVFTGLYSAVKEMIEKISSTQRGNLPFLLT